MRSFEAGVVLASCIAKVARKPSRGGCPLSKSVLYLACFVWISEYKRAVILMITMCNFDQRLRYKDFHLACKPAPIETKSAQITDPTGLFEVETVKEFAAAMEKRGISRWWEQAMGFS